MELVGGRIPEEVLQRPLTKIPPVGDTQQMSMLMLLGEVGEIVLGYQTPTGETRLREIVARSEDLPEEIFDFCKTARRLADELYENGEPLMAAGLYGFAFRHESFDPLQRIFYAANFLLAADEFSHLNKSSWASRNETIIRDAVGCLKEPYDHLNRSDPFMQAMIAGSKLLTSIP